MSAFLRRQLTDYVEYHRDPMNCALHVVGIVILFLGAVLPLSLLPITVLGLQLNLGILLAIPVLIYWIWLDIPIGVAIAGSAALLLFTAATIANHASVTVVWAISVVLIVIGVAMVAGNRRPKRDRIEIKILDQQRGDFGIDWAGGADHVIAVKTAAFLHEHEVHGHTAIAHADSAVEEDAVNVR